MKKVVNKAFFITVCLVTLFANVQTAKAQASVTDSLKTMLIVLLEKISDSSIQKITSEVQPLLKGDSISDLASLKILSIAERLSDMGLSYVSGGLYDKAPPLYQQALTIIRITGKKKSSVYSDILNNLANVFEKLSLYDVALPLYQEAIEIDKETVGENDASYAVTLNNLAHLYESMGQLEKALPLFQQAVRILEKAGKEDHDYAMSLDNLAGAYETLRQYEKAEQLYEKSLKIMERAVGKNHLDYAMSLNNIAYLNRKNMMLFEKTDSLYKQAAAIYKKNDETHPDHAIILGNLASLYWDKASEAKSRLSFNDADSFHKKAESLHFQALEIYKKIFNQNHPAYANGLNNLATLYIDMALYKKADSLYRIALAIRKKTLGERHPSYAGTLNNLGLTAALLTDNKIALELLSQASNIRLRNISVDISTLSELEKRRLIATESFKFDFLPSLLFTANSNDPEVLKHFYNRELVLKGMVLQDQQNIMHVIRQSTDSSIAILYDQWKFNKKLLARQLLLPASRQISYLDSLQNATTEIEGILSRHSAPFKQQLQSQLISINDVQLNLSKNEAVIEFTRFQLYNKKWTDSFIYAAILLLPEDSNILFIPLFEEKKLQRLLRSSPDITTAAIYRLYPARNLRLKKNSASDTLYQLVWKPLEKYLGGVRTIYYAPTGLLHRVAFQALRPDAVNLLIDKYRLKQLLSTRSVAMPVQAQKITSASIWGNIEYNFQTVDKIAKAKTSNADITAYYFKSNPEDARGNQNRAWSSLPETKKEMDSIESLFRQASISVHTNTGAIATEEEFKKLDGNSPQVLHIATHGFFLPPVANANTLNQVANNPDDNVFTVQQNPMFRSGLILAGANYVWTGNIDSSEKEDGILTAYEIAQMDLRHTDLVVLSACETALGDLQGNEGVIGLQRAFKMAGVKQMILSLWRVPDRETMELMTLFYKAWLSGQSTREALHGAQLKMRKKYSPYFWAGFVVVE